MRIEQHERAPGRARRSPYVALTALLAGVLLTLGGSLFVSAASADVPGNNVTVVTNACGEVTFTGVNSDSTILVTIEGGDTFEVDYNASVTVTVQTNPVNYSATTMWTGGDNFTETGSIDVPPCAVKQPTVKKPTVAPDAGR